MFYKIKKKKNNYKVRKIKFASSKQRIRIAKLLILSIEKNIRLNILLN